MIDVLELLAPGDARSAGGRALILLDARTYDASLFARVAREVRAGPGVTCETTSTGTRYRVAHAEQVAPKPHVDAHVLFFVATDTDVKTVVPVARCCRLATFIVHPGQDDSAARALSAERLTFERNRPGAGVPKADAVLLTLR